MTTSIGPICLYCTRFHRDISQPGLTCDAFPAGIPDAIWGNETDHRQPFAGDHGLRFTPATAEDAQYAEETLLMVRAGGPVKTLDLGQESPAPSPPRPGDPEQLAVNEADRYPWNANWARRPSRRGKPIR